MSTLAVDAAAAPIPLTRRVQEDKDRKPVTATITNQVAGEATPRSLSITKCLELDVELLICWEKWDTWMIWHWIHS